MLIKSLDKADNGCASIAMAHKEEFDEVDEDPVMESGDICIDILRKVKGFIVKRDEPAKILGVSVTPLLVRSFLTYIVSAIGIIALTIIQDSTAFAD